MRVRPVAWALAGPGVFALAAVVGGRRVDDYRPIDEPISALAAYGSRAGLVMVAGFLGLGAGTVVLARELEGSPGAPRPVPALLTLAGVTTAAAGLARCSDRTCPTRGLGNGAVTRSDDLHALFSAATFALWIAAPLIAARRAVDAGPRYRRCSRWIGRSTIVVFVLGGLLARRSGQRGSGAAQRLFVASALSWFPLAAAHASRTGPKTRVR
ncbi:MAG: hypothetical protein QOJ71_1266 [Actinomycetota bacterium]|nr:hypothetical protein [Actinomycetota bacterium]